MPHLDVPDLVLQLLNLCVDLVDIVEQAKVGIFSLHEAFHEFVYVLDACTAQTL